MTLRFLKRMGKAVLATPDTVRRVVQKPIVERALGRDLGVTLDLGCGRGLHSLEWLNRFGRPVVAIDFNRDHVRYIAREEPVIHVLCGSAEQLPLRSDVFHTVLCTEVIEHLEHDVQAVREMTRVLRPGGRLVLSAPLFPPPYPDSEHYRAGYNCRDLLQMMEEAGLKVVTVDFCMLFMSRWVLKVIYQWTRFVNVPLPILIPCYLERWVFRKGKEKLFPFDIIILATKEPNAHT